MGVVGIREGVSRSIPLVVLFALIQRRSPRSAKNRRSQAIMLLGRTSQTPVTEFQKRAYVNIRSGEHILALIRQPYILSVVGPRRMLVSVVYLL